MSNPANTCKQSSRLYIPDLCSGYRDQPWQPHRRAQKAGQSATMDKDDFFNHSLSCSKSLYVVELTNISHCLLIVRCQRWLELDEPNWEATWAGRTSDEPEFFFESAKDCSLFVIFYLLSTDELAYLRQSTVCDLWDIRHHLIKTLIITLSYDVTPPVLRGWSEKGVSSE